MAIDILTLAAAKATAGGGGGNTSKYKQPDWGVESGTVDILAETELTVMEDVGVALVMTEVNLTAGYIYTVNFNGADYDCTAFYQDGMVGIALGNAGAVQEGLPVTDDPFFLMTVNEENRENFAGACAMASALDGSVSFTLSIKGTEIHAIPAKYVEHAPVAPLVIKVTGYTIDLGFDTDGGMTIDATFDEIHEAVSAGRTVFVQYGDRKYSLLSIDESRIVFGSYDTAASTASTFVFVSFVVTEMSHNGEPVACMYRHSYTMEGAKN